MPANRWLRKFVPNRAIAASSDELTALYRLAKQGLGITPLPHYVGDPDDTMHKLMELPKGCHHEIWILTHPDLRHTARVKTFMTFMHQEIKAEDSDAQEVKAGGP